MKILKAHPFLAGVIIAATCLWISSCVHENPLPAGTPLVCFDKEILPLFVNSCSIKGCHDGVSLEDNWTITNYQDVMMGITPGDPDHSHFYLHIIGKSEGLMPPGRPLTLESRSVIRVWILQGADSTCPLSPKKSYPAMDNDSNTVSTQADTDIL